MASLTAPTLLSSCKSLHQQSQVFPKSGHPGKFHTQASHNIKHKDRHRGSPPWLLQLKGGRQMGKDREKGFMFIPAD